MLEQQRSKIRKQLLYSTKKTFLRIDVLVNGTLLLLILITAFFVVMQRYENKQLVNQQQDLFFQQEALKKQWSQILIEYSTLTTTAHLMDYAKKHNMKTPSVKQIKVINLNSNNRDHSK